MKKRILIFGICLDRCLDIFEYGDSVNYKKLVKRVKNSDMNDEDKMDECMSNGGSWFVRGCSGLMSYWNLGGYWEGSDMDEFRFNIIKYKGIDVDWNEDKEEMFIYEFFGDCKEDYDEYVKEVKKFIDEVEEEDSWRKILNNNYEMEDDQNFR